MIGDAASRKGYVNGEQIVMDGGEQLKGASEFESSGRPAYGTAVADDEAAKKG